MCRSIRSIPLATFFAIDLRDLDRSEAYEWRDLLDAEPYGVRYDSTVTTDESLGKLARGIYALTGNLDAPCVRGDSFIDAATRSHLFDLLQETAGRDRRMPPFDLGVDDDPIARVVRLYRRGRLIRVWQWPNWA